ncbi:MAG: SDR family NAD(P)-dependent oxidoreductase [Bacteroidales bacterium]|nr:SDR family NAD(P)-dependent oxidoreductase [Bacteroidales bacterium]
MKKNILITGSTDGIGKIAAMMFAKEGHTVLIHGRNKVKLSETLSEIKLKTNNENVQGFVADFSDLDSVKQMAEQIKQEISKIDILINNAGVYNSPDSDNKDGLDIRLTVNYLAPYLLTNDLLPLLEKGFESRIINLASAAQSPVSIDVLLGKVKKNQGETYAQSKLALSMWSFWLARSLQNISVIAVNPGSLLNTKMANEAFGTHWAPAEKGANIIYDLAISEEHKSITGKYFDNDSGAFANAHPDAYNEATINKLIEVTESIIN